MDTICKYYTMMRLLDQRHEIVQGGLARNVLLRLSCIEAIEATRLPARNPRPRIFRFNAVSKACMNATFMGDVAFATFAAQHARTPRRCAPSSSSAPEYASASSSSA